ncbi:sugar-binding protein [Paenibacillus urinalis]|uniref:Sugar-binding protein n=1 Tax=Paenibacillus urinalis TaxID=521520 RepID=A0ABY7XBI1_9BACL|nr:sugar-binding protein [Paenibacillus urinalis]WDH99427.1 sugar-binding protein [Paenibacillus urinalis]WDI03061.1 sugar-binding protein [Paenibacillus urinalis]
MTRARMLLKPVLVTMAALPFVFTSGFGSWSDVSAALTQKEGHKVMYVGETYTVKMGDKQSGVSYQWSSDRSAVASVDQNGVVTAISPGSATITCLITNNGKTTVQQTKIVVNNASKKPSPEPGKVTVDENGFDSNGRMVAYFGSPVIDGNKDKVWSRAQAITPKHVSDNLDTSAEFKALWDDHALYILAEVKDKDLSVQSETPYMQDSVEVFLDEYNNKTQEYGTDDLHYRVNYENVQSIDNGNREQIYSSAKKVEGGYVVETRIALRSKPENGTVMGIELQVNDAKGSERIGSINVFDSSGNAWNDTGRFGEVLLTGKTKEDISGVNPYDLLNLVKSTIEMDYKRYRNASVVQDAIMKVVSENVLDNSKLNQDQIDDQYAALKHAISKLEMTEEAANEKHFERVPDEYRVQSEEPGTIQSLTYKAPNVENGTDDKRVNVYLPHGYDPANTTKKYNVLYLMHGGGENVDTIFGGPGQTKELKMIIDNMIAKGDIEPLIVVTPSFYGGTNDTATFHEELINIVLPLVETEYNTYSETASLDDLKASRAHRAFGGFSMGSVTTWNTFVHALDYFKYFMPLSGDSWVVEQRGGGIKPMETAEYLAKAATDAGYGPKDFYVFSATGSADTAYPNLKPQIDAMKQLTDTFIYSSDKEKGNFYFIAADGGTHAWYWVNQYIYNILPDLFE